MTVLTSCEAAAYFDGAKVGKMTDITPTINRDALDTTGIGDCDRTFVYGQRNSTFSGNLLYDPEDPATVRMLNRIQDDDHRRLNTLRLVMRKGSLQGDLEGDVVITSQATPITVGALASASVSFQVSGKVRGTF
jgi:hypothetical protein